MWYLDYYDFDTYNHETPANMEGWETHPVPRAAMRAPSRTHAGFVTGKLMGRDVTFEILPDLEPGWRSSHHLVAVSQSDRFAMGLCSCGKVFIDGFLGYGDYEAKCDLVHWEGITSIATGPGKVVGIRSNGRIKIAGYSKKAMQSYKSWRDIVQVSVGEECILGLRSDGTVLANDYSGLGHDVSSWRDIVYVSAGDNYVLGVRRDGAVAYASMPSIDEEYEVDVSSWTDIVQADAGPYHAVGMRRDGTVVVAESQMYYEFMEDVECLDVGDWCDVAHVRAGDGLTAALCRDGSVYVARNRKRGYFIRRPASVGVELRNAVAISVNRHYEGSDEVLALDARGRAWMCDQGRAYPWDNWDAE